MPARDRDARELRAVAPLIGGGKLVGPVLLVTNGHKTIAMTSAELLRAWDPKQLAVVTALDGSSRVPVASWGMGRYSGIGMIELGAPVTPTADVIPLPIANVCASLDTRGAPSALCTITGAFTRELVPIHVDVSDGGGMSDDLLRLVTPHDAAHATLPTDGAVIFTWFPPDPVLGRKSEVLAVAMAYPARPSVFQPRAPLPVIAEMVGLDDAGRALIQPHDLPGARPELHEVTGEIAEVKSDRTPIVDGIDEYRQKRERT